MLQELLQIYDQSQVNAGKPECSFAETLIFNEGWLLRAVLKEWQDQPSSSGLDFLPFPRNARVYSEAQLYTPFKARFRGDKEAEGHTHADGIVGEFVLAGATSGVVLKPKWRYLAVFEAKMFSPLSRGVKHAPHYDQVSRTAACMVHAILESGRKVGLSCHLAILYAADNKKVQPEQYTLACMKNQISERVQGYLSSDEPPMPDAKFLREWQDVLPSIQIHFLTWEDVLAEIGNDDLDRFYSLCKRFN